MARSTIFTIMASIAVVIMVLWLLFRSPDCRADGALLLQVGESRYLVPAWMDPFPYFNRELRGLEKSSLAQDKRGLSYWCQSTSIPALKVRGFGFSARDPSVRSSYPRSKLGIVRMSQLSSEYRPSGGPLDWRKISSATYDRRIIDTDGHSASIFISLHFASGPSRRFEARCGYGVHDSAERRGKEYVERCVTIVPLERGNALEFIVNPGDDPAAIGRELIQSLRAVEIMTRATERISSP